MRRANNSGLSRASGRWTAPDVFVTVAAFFIHWELGLAALALKFWHQASGHPGTMFTFAREKWDALAAAARSVFAQASGMSFAGLSVGNMGFGTRSSGNAAFDTWRAGELQRIEAERARLRGAEREFTAYRDELMHAKDQEDFDRFMRDRGQPS